MLTRRQLEIINRRTLKYPLHIAEKDYFLAIALKTLAVSPLSRTLIFKGGTALHHCYLDQYRFSEDLDFSTNQSVVTIEELRAIFADGNSFTIKKEFASGNTVKIERLQFSGPLIQPNALKIEIDFKQNVILPAQKVKYKNVWGMDFFVNTMDPKEICAEKIRAMSGRARYRDFYDFFLLNEKYRPDLHEIIGYVSQKEIRKPITKADIINNWQIIGSQKETEMGRIFYTRKVDDREIADLIGHLPFTKITSA